MAEDDRLRVIPSEAPAYEIVPTHPRETHVEHPAQWDV